MLKRECGENPQQPRYCDNDENLGFWRTLTPLVNWEGEVSRMNLSQETCQITT